MNVSGVSGNSYTNIYSQLSSGKKINTAADGASEMAIIQKENTAIGGMDAGSQNIQSGISALNIADGALGQVTDYLQSIKELSVKASNGLLDKEDRGYIQEQINQYKQGIADIVGTAKYNETSLLSGEKSSLYIATDSDGGNVNVGLGASLMEQLGIDDYDVSSGNFDMKVIDDAISTVSKMRSGMGAQTNALTAAYNMNQNTSYNLNSAVSSIEDLDIPTAVSEKKKQETLQQYALMMQKKRMEDEKQRAYRMFDM